MRILGLLFLLCAVSFFIVALVVPGDPTLSELTITKVQYVSVAGCVLAIVLSIMAFDAAGEDYQIK